MDRLKREGNPPVGQLASPIPQYKKPGSTDYEAVEGQHGAPFATLKDASGNVVSPATDAKLEQVKSELELVKSELQTIKANQLSGDQKVTLSGNIVPLYQRHEALTISAQGSITLVPFGTHLDYKEIWVVIRWTTLVSKWTVSLHPHRNPTGSGAGFDNISIVNESTMQNHRGYGRLSLAEQAPTPFWRVYVSNQTDADATIDNLSVWGVKW